MTERFVSVFGDREFMIAMVHLGALPGSSLHDAGAGPDGPVDGVRKDLRSLRAMWVG